MANVEELVMRQVSLECRRYEALDKATKSVEFLVTHNPSQESIRLWQQYQGILFLQQITVKASQLCQKYMIDKLPFDKESDKVEKLHIFMELVRTSQKDYQQCQQKILQDLEKNGRSFMDEKIWNNLRDALFYQPEDTEPDEDTSDSLTDITKVLREMDEFYHSSNF